MHCLLVGSLINYYVFDVLGVFCVISGSVDIDLSKEPSLSALGLFKA